ncbi:helix-turn-helix transcriptional regulator [Streptomyces sp. NPDC037389]|uniref:helix-turn-helix domain-containing protein n=1 Tax=Streptomyces sp. NPDC037389 TaxID=3155369 RepID=UPI0033FB5863
MPARKSTSGRKPSARRTLAEELARLREESGRSLSELAEETTYDRAYLHKLEKGERLGSPEVMKALDQVYGTDKHLSLLWELATVDVIPDKYKRFMALERDAMSRCEFSVSTVPGLLQTEGYAREILKAGRPRTEDELEEQVTARLARQEWLRNPDQPHYRVLLDEAVLCRAAQDPKVWHEQLDRLAHMDHLSYGTLQVVPFSAGLHDLLGGSLTLLWLPNGDSVAYVESSVSGDLHEDAADVERLRLSYDLLRDSALSPRESVAYVQRLMEDSSTCGPRDQT